MRRTHAPRVALLLKHYQIQSSDWLAKGACHNNYMQITRMTLCFIFVFVGEGSRSLHSLHPKICDFIAWILSREGMADIYTSHHPVKYNISCSKAKVAIGVWDRVAEYCHCLNIIDTMFTDIFIFVAIASEIDKDDLLHKTF